VSGFEFLFSLFGLLLGFSLVEVFAGFGRLIELSLRRDRKSDAPATRIGWLSPLLGVFVIFNLVSYWTAAWAARDAIPVQYISLLFGLAVTGGYYFAAFLIFPRDMEKWDDLDNHYFEVKRWVAAVIAVCNALGALGLALVGLDPFATGMDVAMNAIFYTLLIALVFARGRMANLIILILMVAEYPLGTLAAYLTT
jgi:hypothetical protein